MVTQNFTQYCTANNYPSDYDTLFEAQYIGSLGLAGRISKRAIKSGEDKASHNRSLNSKAHREYYNAVRSGEIIDLSGDLTKEGILAREQKASDNALQSKRDGLYRQIEIIEGLGRMSHLPSGKLKKPYQRTVDNYQDEIDKLREIL